MVKWTNKWAKTAPRDLRGRVLGFRILWDLRGWASKDQVTTPWPSLHGSFFIEILNKYSSEVGCLALRCSGIGRAGFPKTKWPSLFPPLSTLRHEWIPNITLTVLSVSFIKHPYSNFLSSPEGDKNISLGRDFSNNLVASHIKFSTVWSTRIFKRL